MPALFNQPDQPRALTFEHERNAAIREGEWELVGMRYDNSLTGAGGSKPALHDALERRTKGAMKQTKLERVVWAAALLAATEVANASVRPSGVFGDHMVLQRDAYVPVWGTAAPGETVTVRFANQKRTATAGAQGRWEIRLDPMPASAVPRGLAVFGRLESATSSQEFTDVLVGDVWLCAGPGFERLMCRLGHDAKREIALASCPQLRLLRPDVYTSVVPVADINPAEWVVVSPETISMYPISWYFGRDLQAATGVPVGLVLATKASDRVADWLAWRRDQDDKRQARALATLAQRLPQDIADAETWLQFMRRWEPGDPIDSLPFPSHIPYQFYGRHHPGFGGPYPLAHLQHTIYNAMIGPLAPMALHGVVLFTEFGPRNRLRSGDLALLVQSWRDAWGRPDLPFILPETLAVHSRVERVDAAVKNAAGLPGVTVLARTAGQFSDRKGGGFWRKLAALAKDVPAGKFAPAQEPPSWPPAATVRVPPVKASLETAHIFGDNMVLQCDRPVKVWGWAEPGETVSVSFAGQVKQGVAGAKLRWQITLDRLPVSASPRTMTVAGRTETVRYENVVVGEVWVNSGQSNAGFAMGGTFGFDEERPRADHPETRYFRNVRAANVLPQRRNEGEWVVATPETVGAMSGQGYYFAKAIQQQFEAPVGIVEANHGGSSIFSWTSHSALAASPKLKGLLADLVRERDRTLESLPALVDGVQRWAEGARRNAALMRPTPPFPIDMSPVRPFYSWHQNIMRRRGSMFYNTMIYPMIGAGIRGVLWNQGEADTNVEQGSIYDELMVTMVADWRKSWGYDFPFYFVQMPAIKGRRFLLRMWQAQTRAMERIPNSGMIVCNDISEAARGMRGIHPRDKKSVGERLARLALVRTYGVRGMIDSSPFMRSVRRDGNRVVVTFSSVGKGLKTRDGRAPDSWQLAGADGRYVAAQATLSAEQVALAAEGIGEPASVRLGWTADSNCNLVNSAGLPAMPFSAAIGSGHNGDER